MNHSVFHLFEPFKSLVSKSLIMNHLLLYSRHSLLMQNMWLLLLCLQYCMLMIDGLHVFVYYWVLSSFQQPNIDSLLNELLFKILDFLLSLVVGWRVVWKDRVIELGEREVVKWTPLVLVNKLKSKVHDVSNIKCTFSVNEGWHVSRLSNFKKIISKVQNVRRCEDV